MADEQWGQQVGITGDGNVVGDESISQVVKAEGGSTVEKVTQIAGDLVMGDKVTVAHEGASQRDRELAYLDGLLKRYEYWRDHYTPLAGIAEVRARRSRMARKLTGCPRVWRVREVAVPVPSGGIGRRRRM